MDIEKIAERIINAGASADYIRKRQMLDKTFKYIEKLLEKHAKKQRLSPDHYGYVGDLDHVEEKLEEIARFLED